MRLTTDRRYDFPLSAGEFWARIGQVDHYQRWWPWLHEFDGQALRAGDVWQCEVHPPAPYVVRFSVALEQVIVDKSVTARISGDIEGTAALHIWDEASGCTVRLQSALAPAKQSLRFMSIVARPVLRFGHNWILDAGVRQFRTSPGPPSRA